MDEKATQLHAIASLKVLLDATKPQRGGATTSAANHVKINLKETTLADRPNGNIDTTLDSVSQTIFKIYCIFIGYVFHFNYERLMACFGKLEKVFKLVSATVSNMKCICNEREFLI